MMRFCAVLSAMLALATPAVARLVDVHDLGALARAMADARAGDEIVLADGSYAITAKLHAAAGGTAAAPIIVRAAHRLGAHMLSTALVGIEVTGPYWQFDGLDIAGACRNDSDCEHAFHVVGGADGFRLSHSRLADFNAHLKVNADGARRMPGGGLVEANEFFDTRPRRTGNPVAPVNIDTAVDWVIRDNWIHDFQKIGPGDGAYGAFVKGGSRAPLLEHNLVECSTHGASVGVVTGLSFGADGMDANLCTPHWDTMHPCDPEVTGGVMRNNIVRACSGDGIYLSKARDSKILNNTLSGTAGLELRNPSTSPLNR